MDNIQQPSPQIYQQAKALFLSGELVAFPTETIYGLGANALDPQAVSKIFQLKNRPNNNPLIMHFGQKSEISKHAYIQNEIQQHIIDKLFPGPISLLLAKKDHIPSAITPNPFVAVRMPSNQIAQDLLTTVELPIAAPSANLSSKPSPTSAQMVYDNFQQKIPLIIDGGVSEFGIESSVIKVDTNGQKPKIGILRPGFITKEDLDQLFQGEVEVSYTSKEANMSPGTMYRHYTIDGEICIISHSSQIIDDEPFPRVLIATDEFLSLFETTLLQKKNLISLSRGSESNIVSCAHNLFQLYHDCEKKGIKKIYIQHLSEEGIGFAIMNRVKRSAEK